MSNSLVEMSASNSSDFDSQETIATFLSSGDSQNESVPESVQLQENDEETGGSRYFLDGSREVEENEVCCFSWVISFIASCFKSKEEQIEVDKRSTDDDGYDGGEESSPHESEEETFGIAELFKPVVDKGNADVEESEDETYGIEKLFNPLNEKTKSRWWATCGNRTGRRFRSLAKVNKK